MMRSFAMLIAAFALILALLPGPAAYAVGTGTTMETTSCAPHNLDGCAPAMKAGGQLEQHGVGSCDILNCCLGAVCVVAGLLPAAVVTLPTTVVTVQNAFVVSTALTGRDVAPPLDPPKPFV